MEQISKNADVLTFVNNTIDNILNKLDDTISKQPKKDLSQFSMKSRKALSNLLVLCTHCLILDHTKNQKTVKDDQLAQVVKKIQAKHPRLQQRLKDLRLYASNDGQPPVEQFNNKLESIFTTRTLK